MNERMITLQFASRFENIPNNVNKEAYTNLSFFNFAFTTRNWTGEKYIEREQIEGFISELTEHDKIISPQFQSENFVPFYFFLDVSVFNSREAEGNLRLLDFLEELDDFHETEMATVELEKRRNKYLSKLRYYMGKAENLGYLYRWSFLNDSHSLASEVKDMVEREIEVLKAAFRKNFDLNKLSDEQFNKFGEEGDRLAALYSKKEEEVISKLMKYSYSEPSLFLFNAYFVAKWIEHYKNSCNMFKSYFVITQYWTKNKILTDIYQGQNFYDSCMVFQEMMGDYLGIISQDLHWYTTNLCILDKLDVADVHEEVLKSIAKWATRKIYKNKKYPLPKKKWVTDVTWDFLINIGIKQITFIREKEIEGPNGKETIVYAKANIGEKTYIIYPIIDPSNWENLSRSQKALMTYTLCLYHDITVENAFSFEQEEDASKLLANPFVNNPEKLVFEGIKAKSKVNQVNNHNKTSASRSKHQPHKEHWVTFHFRKLTSDNESSEQAQEKAAKYDIEIPGGFTFIDAHMRGGSGEGDKQAPKVSALDIFSKTVSK